MAERNFRKDVGSLEQGIVILTGILNVHSDSSVLATSGMKGATLTKPAGTGIYQIALADKFNAILHVSVQPYRGTVADYTTVVNSISGSTIQFTNMTAGSAADPTSCSFHILVIARNSSVS